MTYVKQDQRGDMAALITQAVGRRAHIKMNFIPCMITCVALDQALKACDAAAQARATAIKAETRKLRAAVRLYGQKLASELGDGCNGFQAVVRKFDEFTKGDQQLAELQSILDGKNTKGCADATIGAHVTAAQRMLAYAKQFDEESDRRISKALISVVGRGVAGQSVHREREPEILEIERLLRGMGEKGYKAANTALSKQWLTVIANRASILADSIIDEECPDAV